MNITEKQIYNCLAKYYSSQAYVILPQLRDGTAYQTAGREADAVVFGCWPSRGLTIEGFEIKSYRGDFLKEIATPEKAESIASFCDRWWIVTAPGIAKLEEIPNNWGWIECDGKKLDFKKHGNQLEHKEISRIFLASIMRNTLKNYVPISEINERVETLSKTEVAIEKLKLEHKMEYGLKLAKTFEDFKEASGIDLTQKWKFPAKEMGALIKALMDQNLKFHLKTISSAAMSLSEIIVSLNKLKNIYEKEDANPFQRHSKKKIVFDAEKELNKINEENK